MKIKNLAMSVLAVGISSAAMSQAQINLSGSYLQTTGNEDNRGMWGGGVGAKFFLGNHVALGAAVNSFPKAKNHFSVGGYDYVTTDLVTNAAGTFDLLLNGKSAPIQPYIGADAGLTWSGQTVSFKNGNNSGIENKNTNTYFLVAPKLGVNVAISPAVGIFGQAKYNFNFGDGENTSWENVPDAFKSEPVKEFFNFDVGVYFRFQGAK